MLDKIEEALKYKFNNPELLNEAISLNQKLIDLGNDYLIFHLNNKLIKEFTFFENGILNEYYKEDVITSFKNNFLSKDNFNNIIIKLKLNDIIENPFDNYLFLKALVGSLAIEINDQNKLANLVDDLLNINNSIILGIEKEKNYPSLVFEWDKKKNKELPQYEIIKEKIKSMNELKTNGNVFAKIVINSFDKPFIGSGYSNFMAIIDAFKNTYSYLEENDLLLKMTDIVGNPDVENCVNQLQELYLKGFIKEPVYKIGLKGSNAGVDIWKCRILIEGIRESFSAEDTSKKNAKRQAAYQMVTYILNK